MTKEELNACIEVVTLVGQMIRVKGSIPSGELYATLMGHLNIDAYTRIIDMLTQTGLVKNQNNLLTWVG